MASRAIVHTFLPGSLQHPRVSLYRPVLFYCTQPKPTEGEEKLRSMLLKKFPKAEIEVNDISGGCGSMYEVHVRSEEFKGVPTIKQHRLVQEALAEDIKNMHGLRVFTEAPK